MDWDTVMRVLAAFDANRVDYVVIGGVALNFHGIARATEDLDVFIAPDPGNVDRLRPALHAVYDDPSIDEITAADLCGEYPAVRYEPPGEGVPIDILTRLGERFRFADIEHEHFTWTRGKPATFQSSSIAERDFCPACGTPLTYRLIGGPRIEIMTGTFDRPDRVAPTRQYGTESRLGWVVGIANLPSQTTMQNYGPEKMGTIKSHQHPDHD